MTGPCSSPSPAECGEPAMGAAGLDQRRVPRVLGIGKRLRPPVDQTELFCGWTLGRAHARSGDPIVAIPAYIGDDDALPEPLPNFAELCADQTERDYQAFLEALRTGRLKAEDRSLRGTLPARLRVRDAAPRPPSFAAPPPDRRMAIGHGSPALPWASSRR
jgi:hypothetical protein